MYILRSLVHRAARPLHTYRNKHGKYAGSTRLEGWIARDTGGLSSPRLSSLYGKVEAMNDEATALLKAVLDAKHEARQRWLVLKACEETSQTARSQFGEATMRVTEAQKALSTYLTDYTGEGSPV